MIVEEILKEDDTGAIYSAMASASMGMGGMGMGGGMLGMHFSSDADFVNAFVTPFTDVVSTALGSAKEIVRKAGTTLNVAFHVVVSTLIPFMKTTYTDVFKQEADDIKAIRTEYGKVYDRVWASFMNHDTQLLSFMCSPGGFITGKAADATPRVAVQLLDVATGGQVRPWLKDLYEKTVHGKKGTGVSSFWGKYGEEAEYKSKVHMNMYTDTRFGESLVRRDLLEHDEEKKSKKNSEKNLEKKSKKSKKNSGESEEAFADFYREALSSKFVADALSNSSFAKSLAEKAKHRNEETFSRLLKSVEPVLEADDIEQIASVVKKHVDLSKVPKDKREEASSELREGVIDTVVKFNRAVIEARVKEGNASPGSYFYKSNMAFLKKLEDIASREASVTVQKKSQNNAKTQEPRET